MLDFLSNGLGKAKMSIYSKNGLFKSSIRDVLSPDKGNGAFN